jgi:hypothetical protein
VPALPGRASIDSGLGCLFQDVWQYHCVRVVMVCGRRFGRLRFGFVGVGFECGEDDDGGLLDDFKTLGDKAFI